MYFREIDFGARWLGQYRRKIDRDSRTTQIFKSIFNYSPDFSLQKTKINIKKLKKILPGSEPLALNARDTIEGVVLSVNLELMIEWSEW